jgi:hypothetical protein
MQADAYDGFNRLYDAVRRPGPVIEVACWAHARRYLLELARLNNAPIGIEAVARIDALFAIEREINGLPPAERRRVRQERSKPLVEALGIWLREQYPKVSPNGKTAKAIAYSLNGWTALCRFLDDGRLCMSNNAAERALRVVAVGRRNWTFAGSDEGGRRAAAIYTLIETAKLNDVGILAWLADVLARLHDHPPSASTSSCPGTGSGITSNALLPYLLRLHFFTPRQASTPRPSPDFTGGVPSGTFNRIYLDFPPSTVIDISWLIHIGSLPMLRTKLRMLFQSGSGNRY